MCKPANSREKAWTMDNATNALDNVHSRMTGLMLDVCHACLMLRSVCPLWAILFALFSRDRVRCAWRDVVACCILCCAPCTQDSQSLFHALCKELNENHTTARQR